MENRLVNTKVGCPPRTLALFFLNGTPFRFVLKENRNHFGGSLKQGAPTFFAFRFPHMPRVEAREGQTNAVAAQRRRLAGGGGVPKGIPRYGRPVFFSRIRPPKCRVPLFSRKNRKTGVPSKKTHRCLPLQARSAKSILHTSKMPLEHCIRQSGGPA